MTQIVMRFVAAGLVSACLATAACSSVKDGSATPAPSSAPSSGNASADPNVPKVKTPLDASKYVGDPCKLVPDVLISSLGYPDPGKFHPADNTPLGQAGPGCYWIASDARSVQMTLGTVSRERGAGGLAGFYRSHAAGVLPFLEPAPDVDGYPAVYIDIRDRRSSGSCHISVGIADDLEFAVATQGYQGEQDSCGAVQQVAGAVIKTLKGA